MFDKSYRGVDRRNALRAVGAIRVTIIEPSETTEKVGQNIKSMVRSQSENRPLIVRYRFGNALTVYIIDITVCIFTVNIITGRYPSTDIPNAAYPKTSPKTQAAC